MKQYHLSILPSLHLAIFSLLSCIFVLPMPATAQNCYIPLSDASGVPVSQQQLDSLEAAACALVAAFPAVYQDSFKVYDVGFYLHQENMEDGYSEVLARVEVEVRSQSAYYLLFGRQSDKTGANTHLWVYVQWPSEGRFSCTSAVGREIIQLQAAQLASAENAGADLYSKEVTVMRWLEQKFEEVVECCDLATGAVCELCPTAEEVAMLLRKKGYHSAPCEVSLTVASRPGAVYSLPSSILWGDGSLLVEYPETNYAVSMEQVLSNEIGNFDPNNPGVINGYVSKNDDLCNPAFYGLFENGFRNPGADGYLHSHIWENQDTTKPDTVFYKEEFYLEVELPTIQVEDEMNICNGEWLPDYEPLMHYAVSNMGQDTFYGYFWEGGEWIKSNLVEYYRPINTTSQYALSEKEYSWDDGVVFFWYPN